MLRKWKFATSIAAMLVILGCSLFQPQEQAPGDVANSAPPEDTGVTVPAPTEAETPTLPAGTPITFRGGNIVIPAGLASTAVVEEVPASLPDESMPWWNTAPAHVKLSFQGYALQGKFHEPQIVIYPAEEYAAVNESVASNLNDLQGLIVNPAGAGVPGAMPGVPFFNAGAVLSAQTALLSFAGGQGIRTVTQYSQFYSQVNNAELFYLFEGLTADGKTYVVVILPVTAPLLAADGSAAASPPPGGVPFPGFDNVDASLFETYYRSVTDLLNGTPGDQFQPALGTLDALVQSLEVTR